MCGTIKTRNVGDMDKVYYSYAKSLYRYFYGEK